MKKQPALVNYFFSDAYVDLLATIKAAFSDCGERIASSWDRFTYTFGDLKDDIVDVVTFDAPFSGFFKAIGHCAKFGWAFGLLFFNAVVMPICTAVFTVVHVVAMLLSMLFIYLTFLTAKGVDAIYRSIKRITSGCTNCGEKSSLPIYICPNCGAEHDALIPSKYGIFKRTCECGYVLPTMALNGRNELKSICPHCRNELKAGTHTETWIPVIGGSNAGKTCFINMAIAQIERKVAPTYGLEYQYLPNPTENYADNIAMLDQGNAAMKTVEDRLQYYQFMLEKTGEKVKHNISLCDIKGEAYENPDLIKDQRGYKNADAFIIIIDPLSIQDFRDEVSGTIDVDMYGSAMPMDEALGVLLNVIDNMTNRVKGGKISNAAVVFTKCDFDEVKKKIGKIALNDYMTAHPNVDSFTALNTVCKDFLNEYSESNLINILESRFKTVQFFTCSALGHVADGATKFVPDGVEAPILWLLSKDFPSFGFSK